MNSVLEQISRIGIIPVIAIDDANKAVPLARALVAGGLPAAEITFRTAAAEEVMRRIIKEVPEMLVGAGTVLTHEHVDRALDAGAKFVVSPGFNPDTVKYVLSKGGIVMPGTATPGEMEQAMALGLDAVKFFPAEQSGGIEKLKAIAGPYKSLRWMPTGGVNTKNMMDYLSFPQILACGGTWMVKNELIVSGNWEAITQICREAVQTMLGFSLAHVGIACGDAENAAKTAKTICNIMGFEYRSGNSSDFAGTVVECTKKPFPGTNGHIAIATYSIDRAIYQMEQRGVAVDESTRKVDDDGNTKSIYLAGEFGGFAIHFVKKS